MVSPDSLNHDQIIETMEELHLFRHRHCEMMSASEGGSSCYLLPVSLGFSFELQIVSWIPVS
jgi:hypothetical protein